MTERITIRETVRIKLEESSDPEYREFHSRLLRESPASWECAHPCSGASRKT